MAQAAEVIPVNDELRRAVGSLLDVVEEIIQALSTDPKRKAAVAEAFAEHRRELGFRPIGRTTPPRRTV